ncbi:ML domain-containing protein [Cryomyces antarcticus]|nr:Phosphatidylglycerol/phosphatidylinositol transfer protein [Cryomyces antarcticus]KAK5172425.1 hypothetical protein LTR04_005566 [Oleoguttula sp. CCFEE 6159]
MKITTVLAPLLLTSAVAASRLVNIVAGTQQVALEDNLAVPGNSPLFFCSKADKDILTIEHVDLTPNPPEAGKNLTISARGTLSADIEDGAKVHLQVKYGLIRLINQEADLCETVKNVDLNCPLKKGEMELKKDVELPKEIPPGKYTVLADVFTKDGDKITCLTATVVFHR